MIGGYEPPQRSGGRRGLPLWSGTAGKRGVIAGHEFLRSVFAMDADARAVPAADIPDNPPVAGGFAKK